VSATTSFLVLLAAAGISTRAAVDDVVSKRLQTAEIRLTTATFTDCVVRKHAPLVRAVVMSNLPEKRIKRFASDLLDGYCLSNTERAGGSLGFSTGMLRLALAEALIRADYPAPDLLDFSTTPSLPDIDKTMNPNGQKDRKVMPLRYTECVCRKSPGATWRFLSSKIESSEEIQAFKDLDDEFDSCFWRPGFGREAINDNLALNFYRGQLAFNFYRLAGVPAGFDVATLKVAS